jgi:hypothetical protein
MVALITALVAGSALAFVGLCYREAHSSAAWVPPATYMALAGLLLLPINLVHKVRIGLCALLFRSCYRPVKRQLHGASSRAGPPLSSFPATAAQSAAAA